MTRFRIHFLVPVLGCAVAVTGCGNAASRGVALDKGPDSSAMTAEAKTDAGVAVPAFSVEARTVFRGPGDSTEARGTLRLLMPTRSVKDPNVAARIRVQLAGLTPGLHAWNIHSGGCDLPHSPVAVPLSGAAGTTGQLTVPLTVEADSTVTAEIPVPPLRKLWVEAGDYSVWVRAGVDAMTTPMVACASL